MLEGQEHSGYLLMQFKYFWEQAGKDNSPQLELSMRKCKGGMGSGCIS